MYHILTFQSNFAPNDFTRPICSEKLNVVPGMKDGQIKYSFVDAGDSTLSSFNWVGFCTIEAVNITFNNLQNDTLGNTRDGHYVKGRKTDSTRNGIALILSKLVYIDDNGASLRTPIIDMSNSTEAITYFINYIEPFILEDNAKATHIDKSWFGNNNTSDMRFMPKKKVILKMSQKASNVLMINLDKMNLSKKRLSALGTIRVQLQCKKCGKYHTVSEKIYNDVIEAKI
jgi:hypothetical protein